MLSLEYMLNHTSLFLTLVAGVCILISVITEFTKEIGFLNRIPTNLQVLVLSLIICITGFFAYLSYANMTFEWYYLVAIIFASFVVALISAKGWNYFADIVKRYYKK